MKKIFFAAGLLFSFSVFGQGKTASLKNTLMSMPETEIPSAVLTDAGTCWTISAVSPTGYANATPGGKYNSYKSGGFMIVKFKFLKDNRFEFLLYTQANSYGTDTETWTEVNGTVTFSEDAKGQQVFTTRAENGVCKVVKNGAITTRAIPETELTGQYSNTYLWEAASFTDDPGNSYLLVVDMDAHPGVDINQPATISPSWVSKFRIPKKGA